MYSSSSWFHRGISLVVLLLAAAAAPPGPGAAAQEADGARPVSLLSMRGISLKWGEPRFGSPAVIRYAFLDRPLARRGARNCRSMAPLPALLNRTGPAREAVVAEIHKAFEAWQDVANVTFEYVADAALADVVIGAQARPRGIAFADVAYERPAEGLLASIRQGAICFNPAARWETGFDGDERTYDIRYVAMHEIGHILGLDHAWGRRATVMGFRYRETVRAPQPADIAGLKLLYGTRLIPTAANAHAPAR